VEGSLSNLLRAPAPSISASLPEVPPEIDLLIRRLMAKRPEDRIPTSLALFHQIEEIESTLREGSEARTTHRPEGKSHIDTFDVKIPTTRENTRRADSKKATGKVSVVNSDLQTVEFTDHKNLQIESTPIREDYFETVTEKTREKPYVADFEPRENKGTWRLLFAFVFVVAIGIYGVWQAYKPPSAEKLYAAIEQGANKPDTVLLEIGQFLEIYPDEERAEQVLELRRVGDAIRLYKSRRNVLTAKGGQRLTDIEKRFLRIVDDSDENPIKAKKEIDIFVDFLSGVELEPRDQECFEAAKAYRIKIKHDAISELRGNLNRIRSVLDIALQTTDVDEQIRLYKSIISYSKNIDWGRFPDSRQGSDMVQKAQRMLLQLESTHPESFEQLQDENN
jgi:serine/threonine-protein kinase